MECLCLLQIINYSSFLPHASYYYYACIILIHDPYIDQSIISTESKPTGNVNRELHVHGAGRMRRNRIATIAFFGGWTLTLATFIFLVPALPPLKPTLAELSSSNRKGAEVVHRRVRSSTLAKDQATQLEVKDSFQLSNNEGHTFEVRPRRHDDKRRSYDREEVSSESTPRAHFFQAALLITSFLTGPIPPSKLLAR